MLGRPTSLLAPCAPLLSLPPMFSPSHAPPRRDAPPNPNTTAIARWSEGCHLLHTRDGVSPAPPHLLLLVRSHP
jgi:hypothetical protein